MQLFQTHCKSIVKALTISGGLAALIISSSAPIQAYSLDGYDDTGIARLEFYRLAQEGQIRGRQLLAGQKYAVDDITLALSDNPLTALPMADGEFSRKITNAIPSSERSKYSVTVLDYTDSTNIRYAEHNPDFQANVGSVGKLLAGLAVFDQLAKLYPDTDIRDVILKNSMITGSQVVRSDHHKVPIFNVERRKLDYRKLRPGDVGNLYEWLDWMYSASSNSAASVVMEQAVLIKHFQEAYPPSEAEYVQFLKDTTASERGDMLREVMDNPLTDHGINLDKLIQGRPFSWKGKQRYPGGKPSTGNTVELMKLLMLMESGQLIDAWTSLKIKQMMYITQKRIRYASHPVLNNSLVYFKSGSLYSCTYSGCPKYKGNRLNLLASVAMVETPNNPTVITPESYTETIEEIDEEGNTVSREVVVTPEPYEVPADQPFRFRYAVVVHSNVLNKNSAVAHQTLALKIHRIIEQMHPDIEPEPPVRF